MDKTTDHPGLGAGSGSNSGEKNTLFPTVLDGSRPMYARDQRTGAGVVQYPALSGTVERQMPPKGPDRV